MHGREDNYDMPGDGMPKYVDAYGRIVVDAVSVPYANSFRLDISNKVTDPTLAYAALP
jgi:hypothetical protein